MDGRSPEPLRFQGCASSRIFAPTCSVENVNVAYVTCDSSACSNIILVQQYHALYRVQVISGGASIF